MKDMIVIPVFNDQYKVIFTWGNWRRVAQSYHHQISPGEDVLEDRHGVTLSMYGLHPLIIMPRFPKTPDEYSTLAHEAVHAIEDIFTYMGAKTEGEIFAYCVGSVVRVVLENRPKKRKKP